MKRKKLRIVFILIMLCVLGTIAAVNATSVNNDLRDSMEKHVRKIKKNNDEISKKEILNIPVTITLNDSIDIKEVKKIVSDTGIDLVMLQARGYDNSGERITFMTKTYKGLKETDMMLKEMAVEDNVEFVGYNTLFAVIDSKDIKKIEKSEYVYLIDTSSLDLETGEIKKNEKGYSYPHSKAWELEDLK